MKLLRMLGIALGMLGVVGFGLCGVSSMFEGLFGFSVRFFIFVPLGLLYFAFSYGLWRLVQRWLRSLRESGPK